MELIVHGDNKRELFDLNLDLGETNNIIRTHPQVSAELASLLQSYLDRGRSTPGKAQPLEYKISLDEIRFKKNNNLNIQLQTKDSMTKFIIISVITFFMLNGYADNPAEGILNPKFRSLAGKVEIIRQHITVGTKLDQRDLKSGSTALITCYFWAN